MRQLTSLDAQFLAVESARTYGHVGGLAVYDPATAPGGRLEIKDICRLVGERIHLLPPFRWRLVGVPLGLDHPYWIEDPDFDLDFHIRDSAVPPPGDDRQLAETVARIFARPLDRTRPLWELYLIHGLQDGRVALLTKVHHSVVDGVSGNEILAVLLDPSPEGREIPPPDGTVEDGARAERDRDARPRPDGAAAPAAARAALGPDRAAQPDRAARRERVPGRPHVLARRGRGPPPARPRAQGPGDPRGDHRAAAADLVQRPHLRPPPLLVRRSSRSTRSRRSRTRPASRSTTSSSRSARGALRDWLKERDELPREPLVAMVPVSVRTEEQMGTFGNRVSMMIVPIPTNEADPKRRLKRTHELLRGAKGRHQARAREPAHRRDELHPARRRLARRADHDGGHGPHAAAGERRDLQRARPRNPLFLRGRASSRRTTRCRSSSTASGSTSRS